MELSMESAEDIRNLKITVGLYILILIAKLGAYSITQVLALLAEAFHTLADIFVSGFLLIAALYSRRKPDRVHMFGYGRAQNAAALVAATLFISFTSYKLYEEAIPRLFRPPDIEYQNLSLAMAVIVFSMLIAGIPLVNLIRQKSSGPAAKAQLLELINDELGLFAALIGTLFIIWGYPLADPIAAILVATIIAYNGVRLFRENFSYLLGRAPDVEILRRIEQTALSVPGVSGVHDLRAEYVGPGVIHAGFHIEIDGDSTVDQADKIAKEVHEKIHAGQPSTYCYIHVDPARNDALPTQGSS
jgi:cation diffusion facilitator family transporter